MKIPARVRIRLEPWHGVKSPYDGKTGTAFRIKDNIDKYGKHEDIYLVRLDRPNRADIKVVGIPEEALDVINRKDGGTDDE